VTKTLYKFTPIIKWTSSSVAKKYIHGIVGLKLRKIFARNIF